MRANLSLIRDYTPGDDLVSRPVGVTHFQKEEKNLYYVNVHHVSGIDNPTCGSVRTAFEICNPQRVIIEGLPTQCGVSPAFYIDLLKREAARNFPAGEHNYAAFLAHRNNIPFIGGEPSRTEVYFAMHKEGYSAKEITAFSLLRLIPQHRREGMLMDETHFVERAKHYLDCAAEGCPERRMTLPEFEDWYVARRGDERHFLEICTADFAPYGSEASNYFQRLNHRLGMVRERHLDTLIAESLTNADKVLVVYGDGHLVQSRAVFEDMLGPGAAIQLEPNYPHDAMRPVLAVPPARIATRYDSVKHV